MTNHAKRLTAFACAVASALACEARGDWIAHWNELSQWTAAMNAAGAPQTGFYATDVLGVQPPGTPVALDAFAAYGVTMDASGPLEVYNDGGGFSDVWDGPGNPSMYWDIKLATPVYSVYLLATGRAPISFYMGDQLVSQPYGSTSGAGFAWFGIQMDTPFDRIRIQNPGAPYGTKFTGIWWAMPVPGPGALVALLAWPALRSRRRSQA